MTKSTGAREKRERREALFGAELRLYKTRAHLMDALARYESVKAIPEAYAVAQAFRIVNQALCDVAREMHECR